MLTGTFSAKTKSQGVPRQQDSGHYPVTHNNDPATVKVETLLQYADAMRANNIVLATQYAKDALDCAQSLPQSSQAALEAIYTRYSDLFQKLNLPQPTASASSSSSGTSAVSRPKRDPARAKMLAAPTDPTASASHPAKPSDLKKQSQPFSALPEKYATLPPPYLAKMPTAASAALSRGQRYLGKGDTYVLHSEFDKARSAYMQAAIYADTKAQAHQKLRTLPTQAEPLTDISVTSRLLGDWFKNTRAQVINHFKQYEKERGIPHCFDLDTSIFKAQVVSYEEAHSLSDIKNMQQVAQCYNALLRTKHSEKLPLQSEVYAIARHAIQAFSTSTLHDASEVAEIIHIGALADPGLYFALANSMANALDPVKNPIMNNWVAQGLAVAISNYPFEIYRNASGLENLRRLIDIIPPLYARLHHTHIEKNTTQLQIALAPLTELFDLLVLAGVSGIDKVLHTNLDKLLDTLIEYADRSSAYDALGHQARYTQQALAHIGNNETLKEVVAGGTFQLGVAISTLVSGIIKLDPSNLPKIYQNIKALIPGTLADPWYMAARYAEALVKTQEWTLFELFVRKNEYATHPNFLKKICLLLEEIALTHPKASDGAQRLLTEIQDTKYWGNNKTVQNSATQALMRAQKHLIHPLQAQQEARVPTAMLAVWDAFWKTPSTNLFLTQAKSAQQQLQNLQQKAPSTQSAQNATQLKNIHAQHLQSAGDIQEAQALYVPLQGYTQGQTAQAQDLQVLVEAFFKSNKKVLLLLGAAGTGKSTFNRYLAQKKLEAHTELQDSTQPLVIFIELRNSKDPHRDAIKSFLKGQGFTSKQIQQLRTQQRCIFIFDGYDEIKERNRNFYALNDLASWPNAQFIITSRPEYLGIGYQQYFHPAGSPELLQECTIAPLSKASQASYIEKYITHHASAWKLDQYQEALAQLDALEKELDRPVVLHMILQVLPQLNASSKLTLGQVYEAYLTQWWKRAHARLSQVSLTAQEEAAKTLLAEKSDDFTQHGLEYSQDCATALTKDELTVAQRSPEFESAYPDTYRAFFGNDEKARLLLLNAPLQQGADKRYQFTHKSIQEYLVARAIVEQSRTKGWNKTMHRSTTAVVEPRVDMYMNQLDLIDNQVISDFLVEQLKQNPYFKKHVWSWILASRVEPEQKTDTFLTLEASLYAPQQRIKKSPFRKGAANAATLWARAKQSFSGKDLSGVQIPRADLNNGVFDSTDFTRANLENVIFVNAWLRRTKFDKAQMRGVQFGKTISVFGVLEEVASQVTPYFSPNERYYVSADNNHIRCYDRDQNYKVREPILYDFAEISPNTPPIAMSLNSEKILFVGKTGRLEHWSLVEKERAASFYHTDPIRHIALCETGKFAASAGKIAIDKIGKSAPTTKNKHFVKVWSEEKADKPIFGFESSSSITSLALCGKLSIVAFSTKNETTIQVRSWTSNKVYELNNEVQVCSLLISKNGKWIISGNENGTVHVWSLLTGKREHILSGHIKSVLTLALSAEDEFLASGGEDQTVKLWYLPTGQYVYTFTGHTNTLERITFSEEGTDLYSISKNRIYKPEQTIEYNSHIQEYSYAIKHWRLDDIDINVTASKNAHHMRFGVLSPDGKWVTSVDSNNNLWLHAANLSSSKKIGVVAGPLGVPMKFSPDSQWFAWDDKILNVTCYSLRDACIEYKFEIEKNCKLTFSSDSAKLILLEEKEHAYDLHSYFLENPPKAQLIYKQTIPYSELKDIEAFSSNADYIFSTDSGGDLRKWSIRTGEMEILYTPPSDEDINSMEVAISAIEEDIFVSNIVPSPNGKWLAFTNDIYDTGEPEGDPIKIWLYSLENKNKGVENLKHCFTTGVIKNVQFTFSPDEKWIAIGEQNRLVLYPITSQRLKPQIIEHGLTEEIEQIVWQGNKILTSGKYGTSCLWEVKQNSVTSTVCDIKLIWSLPHTTLTLEEVSINGTVGLDMLSTHVLKEFSVTDKFLELAL